MLLRTRGAIWGKGAKEIEGEGAGEEEVEDSEDASVFVRVRVGDDMVETDSSELLRLDGTWSKISELEQEGAIELAGALFV